MMGLWPTGTVARTWPKPPASMGLFESQFGLFWAVAEQRGMLMMLTEPGVVPLPWLATTSSALVGARSAQMGFTPTEIVLDRVEMTVPVPPEVAFAERRTVEPVIET